jgi:hypothetical protein
MLLHKRQPVGLFGSFDFGFFLHKFNFLLDK